MYIPFVSYIQGNYRVMRDFSCGLKGIFAQLGFCFYFVEIFFFPQFRSICL